jgi:hypothetical protein
VRIISEVNNGSLQPLEGHVSDVDLLHRPSLHHEFAINHSVVLIEALQEEPNRALQPLGMLSPLGSGGIARGGQVGEGSSRARASPAAPGCPAAAYDCQQACHVGSIEGCFASILRRSMHPLWRR